MKDSDIKRNVEAELKWDPDIDPTDIAVAVKNGVVTLTGFVRSYSQKYEAEEDVKRVSGVVGIANDIASPSIGNRATGSGNRPRCCPQGRTPVSPNIKVVAKNGWLSLGSAEWNTSAPARRTRCCGSACRASALIVLKPAWLPLRSGQDRGCLRRKCGARRQPHHRRSQRQRGDP